jgi:uncharacterized protein
MVYKRSLEQSLRRYAKFPVVGIFGPRQSGKTTLARQYFSQHTYINLEDPNMRSFITDNPQGFLKEFENDYGIILDEFQYVPQILSYIQIAVDAYDRPGYFVLTGSQNFLMNEAVTQSLAGRIGILTLLPLSIAEISNNEIAVESVYEYMYKGSYPRIYAQDIEPRDLYPSYIHSYIERDVRQLVNVENLTTFQRFLQLCAARIGQQLNITDLATSCGISQKTVHSWLSLLQASYIIFLLQPYYKNFSKRVVKTPKLYFYDTGLACTLLNIRSSQELVLSSFKGPFFECLVLADLFKQYYNCGEQPPLYYWRDTNGRVEIDCIIDRGTSLVALEAKSGEVISASYFEGLESFKAIAQETNIEQSFVVYAGEQRQTRSGGTVLDWKNLGLLVEGIKKPRD